MGLQLGRWGWSGLKQQSGGAGVDLQSWTCNSKKMGEVSQVGILNGDAAPAHVTAILPKSNLILAKNIIIRRKGK